MRAAERMAAMAAASIGVTAAAVEQGGPDVSHGGGEASARATARVAEAAPAMSEAATVAGGWHGRDGGGGSGFGVRETEAPLRRRAGAAREAEMAVEASAEILRRRRGGDGGI